MTPGEQKKFEFNLNKDFVAAKDETKHDLLLRQNGVGAKAGSTGKQFAGYTTLERFYRGDQWPADEPPGAAQRTDNYCAVIVDHISSLIFDDHPEITCPTNDPSDELLEIKAELKEQLLQRVYDDNDSEVEFDEWAKGTSLYGDGFMFGPWMEKVNKDGEIVAPDDKGGTWQIRFQHVENPGSVRLIFSDSNFKRLDGVIISDRISLAQATRMYGKAAEAKGIKLVATVNTQSYDGTRTDGDTMIPMVNIDRYWTRTTFSTHINDALVDFYLHNWGFVPLEHVKNIYVPNHPYGKSDIEDVLDPQLSHNRTNNDLANLLRWISTANFWGKNLEGMQALVAGLSRIYQLPEDGEIHTFEKPGDPYVTNTYVQQRRSALIDISGISESFLSGSQLSVSSGRALAMAYQGTIRKLNPRMKRFCVAMQHINANILKLAEMYFPETKVIIGGDYRTKVFLPATILRNIVDTINKFQANLISLDTAQKEAGVQRPKMEQKVMKKNLEDPVLGPQIARQPALLPRLQEGQNQPGDQPTPGPGQSFTSPGGSINANNQQASGAAPTPVTE